MFADGARGGKKFRERLYPEDPEVKVIPAFKLVEVELSVKGWTDKKAGDVNPATGKVCESNDISPVAKGYGMGIDSIRFMEGASLHSVHAHLRSALPRSQAAAKDRLTALKTQYPSIGETIPTDKVTFYVPEVSSSVRIEQDNRAEVQGCVPQICLFDWFKNSRGGSDQQQQHQQSGEAGMCIDILTEHAMHFTNTQTADAACKLLELAARAGALSVLVVHNPYRRGQEHLLSPLSGVPLVDTEKLLRGVDMPLDAGGGGGDGGKPMLDETGNYYAFEAAFKLPLAVGVPAALATKKGDDDRGTAGSDDGDDGGSESGGCSQLLCDEDGDDDDGDGEGGGEDGEDGDDGDKKRFPTSLQHPLWLVSRQAFWGVKGKFQPPCGDFMLVDATSGSNVQMDWAYYVRLVHPVLQHKCVLFAGYLSMKTPEISTEGACFVCVPSALFDSACCTIPPLCRVFFCVETCVLGDMYHQTSIACPSCTHMLQLS
jgi:hypothetical protein